MELALGFIIIFISLVHVVYGEKKQIDVLAETTNDSILIGSFRVMSLQGGLLLFSIGFIYILSFAGAVTLTGISVYFPAAILILNLLSVILVGFIKHKDLLRATVPQFIIFGVIIAMQVVVFRDKPILNTSPPK